MVEFSEYLPDKANEIIEYIKNNEKDGEYKERALKVFNYGRLILLGIEIKSAVRELHRRGIQAYEAIGLTREEVSEFGIDDFNEDMLAKLNQALDKSENKK